MEIATISLNIAKKRLPVSRRRCGRSGGAAAKGQAGPATRAAWRDGAVPNRHRGVRGGASTGALAPATHLRGAIDPASLCTSLYKAEQIDPVKAICEAVRIPRLLKQPKGEFSAFIRPPWRPLQQHVRSASAILHRFSNDAAHRWNLERFRQALCEDGSRCTTDHHKTHGTGAIDEATVVYGWHPLRGRGKRIRIHERIVRASGAIARVSRVDT